MVRAVPASPLTTLKSSLHRSVLLDAADRRVIKRFRSRGLLRRILDPLRARAESSTAAKLRQSGLRIPELLERRPGDGPCEVHFRLVPGAETLAERRARTQSSELPLRLARTLGRQLGLAHAAGLDHRDLHEGNVLLDASGEPWLIDFQHARVHAKPLPLEVAYRDLVHLAASARETSSTRFRSSFLTGWLEMAPPLWREKLPAREELTSLVESRAREHHRDRLQSRSRRWFRESRVTSELEKPRPLLVRKDLREEASILRALLSVPAEGREEGSDELSIEGRHFAVLPEDRVRWRTLARLEDHDVPAPRPALHDKEQRRMFFEVSPPGTLSPTQREEAWPGLLGRLHDRGLDAADPLDLRELEGALAFGWNQTFVKLDPRQRVSRWVSACGPGLSSTTIETYLSEERGGAAAVRELRHQLQRELSP